MFGAVEFAQPALLFGLAAVAVPVLIHLLLRPRPRRVRFPALALLRGSLESGQRARRTHNLALLLVRAACLALAALLLAGPSCRSAETHVAVGPRAVVLIVDDSASVRYETSPGRTTLDDVCEAALRSMDEAPRWPAGSIVTLLRLSENPSALVWQSAHDPAPLRSRLSDRQPPPHGRPLGEALRAAAGLLARVEQADRRIVVFSDQSASAWRDVAPDALAACRSALLEVRLFGDARRPDLAIRSLIAPPGPLPIGVSATVDVEVSSNATAASVRVGIRAADGAAAAVSSAQLAAGETRAIPVRWTPTRDGMIAIAAELEPADRLPFHQRLYAAVRAGPRPRVWLMARGESLTARLFRNLLAPAGLAADQQRLELIEGAAEALLAGLAKADAPDEARPALVVMLSGVEVSPGDQAALRGLVERGATLLLVPDDADEAVDWPGLRALLCASAPQYEQLASAQTMVRNRGAALPTAGDAWLEELLRCAVRSRVRLGEPVAGAIAALGFADRAPALLWRRVEQGRVVLLATSPAPRWSDLGIRAAGLLTLVHSLAADPAQLAAPSDFVAGNVETAVLAGLPARGNASVRRIMPGRSAVKWVTLNGGRPESGWPTDEPGVYEASVGDARALYSVNVAAEEADLTPLAPDALAQTLGPERVRFIRESSNEGDAPLLASLLARADIRALTAGLLFALVAVEWWMSERGRRIGMQKLE